MALSKSVTNTAVPVAPPATADGWLSAAIFSVVVVALVEGAFGSWRAFAQRSRAGWSRAQALSKAVYDTTFGV